MFFLERLSQQRKCRMDRLSYLTPGCVTSRESKSDSVKLAHTKRLSKPLKKKVFTKSPCPIDTLEVTVIIRMHDWMFLSDTKICIANSLHYNWNLFW